MHTSSKILGLLSALLLHFSIDFAYAFPAAPRIKIDGDAFFAVTTPDGEMLYRRGGALRVTRQGTLHAGLGYPLVPFIVIPRSSRKVRISSHGTVSVEFADDPTRVQVGRISGFQFEHSDQLQHDGKDFLRETPESGAPIEGEFGQSGFPRLR